MLRYFSSTLVSSIFGSGLHSDLFNISSIILLKLSSVQFDITNSNNHIVHFILSFMISEIFFPKESVLKLINFIDDKLIFNNDKCANEIISYDVFVEILNKIKDENNLVADKIDHVLTFVLNELPMLSD